MSKFIIADTLTDFQLFLKDTLDKSNFILTKIKLSDQNEWNLNNGALSHKSGGFFHVAGLIDKIIIQEHLVLYQPQSAITGLAIYKNQNTAYILLQARIEPGNSCICQYGPTIQATPANYLSLHGGKRTSYVDMFSIYYPKVKSIAISMQLDLGKRYYQKSKNHNYIELPELIETEENMIWVPLQVIQESIKKDNFLNADLRSLLSVFDWDLFLYGNTNLNSKISNNNFYQTYLSKNVYGTNSLEFIPLNELTKWEVRDEGIIDISKTGISVSMYQTSCTNREVKTWNQPLMVSSNKGLVILLMRKIDDNFEFLISIKSEFGISGYATILPSYVIYPGENNENKTQIIENGLLISQFILSDEGGRFYQHESYYQLIQVDDEFEIDIDQFWVSSFTFKQLLKTSNLVSIQLRAIASLVLDILNPYTFSK